MSEKKKSLNEEIEVGNRILDEGNEKPRIVLQNKDLAAVSVAQAMIETVHKTNKKCWHRYGFKSKKQQQQKSKELWSKKQSMIDKLREGPEAKMKKDGN